MPLSDPEHAPTRAVDPQSAAEAAVRTVHRFYDAVGAGDTKTALGLIPTDLEWHAAPGIPYAGAEPHRGPEQVAQRVLGPINEDVDALTLSELDFRSLGDTVLVLGRYGGRGRISETPIDQPFAHVWRFAGSTPVEFRQYTDVSTFNAALDRVAPPRSSR